MIHFIYRIETLSTFILIGKKKTKKKKTKTEQKQKQTNAQYK